MSKMFWGPNPPTAMEGEGAERGVVQKGRGKVWGEKEGEWAGEERKRGKGRKGEGKEEGRKCPHHPDQVYVYES